MIDQKIKDFLLPRIRDIKHSGRTFYDHLKGTYDLLTQRHAPDYVCIAGLFHSIYGTNAFQRQSVLLSERDKIIEVIGPQAERLAFIFCCCDRPRVFVNAVRKGPPYQIVNRHDGSLMPLSVTDMSDLLDIEVANLVDQGGGPWLGQVVEAQQLLRSSRKH
jgi:hypothetical protein